MWLLRRPQEVGHEREERPLLPKEHLTLMGVPVFAFLADGLPYPVVPVEFDGKPVADGTIRRFAGNAPDLAPVGSELL